MSPTASDGTPTHAKGDASDAPLGRLGEILVPFHQSDLRAALPHQAESATGAEASNDAASWELRLRTLVGATAHVLAHTLRAPLALAATLVDHGTALAVSALGAEAPGLPAPQAMRLPNEPERCLAAWALQRGEVVLVHALSQETRFDDTLLRQLGMVSALAAPFHVGGSPWGVVGAGETRQGRFGSSETQLAADAAAGLGELLSRLLAPPGGWRDELVGFQGLAQLNEEQRSSPRQRFAWEQRIAPVRHGRLPGPDSLVSVPCHDLSNSGISFFWHGPPDFTELVAALGTPPKLTFLLARVMWFAPRVVDDRPMFLVGCRFTRRVVL